ncbi:hypothetical protein Pmani_011353 [Petrolisthes manimaculis]|uniref:Uncharacterized protein n=1 Tax=Petrolisthes manimaculis TaxID=1843537 RepID=A0AAE1UEI6_9EUCA|nr:hypothetical protein Pmani_011353 [Petrolisthes manimaculis]
MGVRLFNCPPRKIRDLTNTTTDAPSSLISTNGWPASLTSHQLQDYVSSTSKILYLKSSNLRAKDKKSGVARHWNEWRSTSALLIKG